MVQVFHNSWNQGGDLRTINHRRTQLINVVSRGLVGISFWMREMGEEPFIRLMEETPDLEMPPRPLGWMRS